MQILKESIAEDFAALQHLRRRAATKGILTYIPGLMHQFADLPWYFKSQNVTLSPPTKQRVFISSNLFYNLLQALAWSSLEQNADPGVAMSCEADEPVYVWRSLSLSLYVRPMVASCYLLVDQATLNPSKSKTS